MRRIEGEEAVARFSDLLGHTFPATLSIGPQNDARWDDVIAVEVGRRAQCFENFGEDGHSRGRLKFNYEQILAVRAGTLVILPVGIAGSVEILRSKIIKRGLPSIREGHHGLGPDINGTEDRSGGFI